MVNVKLRSLSSLVEMMPLLGAELWPGLFDHPRVGSALARDYSAVFTRMRYSTASVTSAQ